MNKKIIFKGIGVAILSLSFWACTPSITPKTANKAVPEAYKDSKDSTNSAQLKWREFFTDPYLIALIDTALKNNQELNITLQEIQIAKNEIRAKKGEYLPFAHVKAASGLEKVGRYTPKGASEATTDIEPGRAMPEPVPENLFGVFASWEVDIWRKLRNARDAAASRYMASVEGKNFLVTNLVAEIANSYYELLALDNQLEIINQNIEIQTNALQVVKLQKTAARVTELAVKRFEAQVLNTKSIKYEIQQRIIETENHLNFMVGRYPQPIERSSGNFNNLLPGSIYAGLPSQLLNNRPDIRQAELELNASKLDVKVAKANFYPSLNISAGVGLQAFNPAYFVKTPESMLYSLAGDLMAPLVNRNAIKATYKNANAKQIQAAYNYEKTLLNAYVEVANQMANIGNLSNSYDLKSQEVKVLNKSVKISNDLFKSAMADYMEVLLTQRDFLEAKFELIDTKVAQMHAMVKIYRALGGGWN